MKSPRNVGIYITMRWILLTFLLAACAGTAHDDELKLLSAISGDYDIAFWSRDGSDTAPVHIYIEGDGHAFDAAGNPTADPTPHGRLVRDMAARDPHTNVAYLARPCQYVMSDACNVHDWTDGRFSAKIISEMSDAVRFIARNRPVILIGYSGGAFVSAAIIEKNPDLNVRQWITVAGVLNHSDWTEYFGDAPLTRSVTVNILPRVSARHYVASRDSVVPMSLSARWVGAENLIIVPGARHNRFPDIKIDFAD